MINYSFRLRATNGTFGQVFGKTLNFSQKCVIYVTFFGHWRIFISIQGDVGVYFLSDAFVLSSPVLLCITNNAVPSLVKKAK